VLRGEKRFGPNWRVDLRWAGEIRLKKKPRRKEIQRREMCKKNKGWLMTLVPKRRAVPAGLNAMSRKRHKSLKKERPKNLVTHKSKKRKKQPSWFIRLKKALETTTKIKGEGGPTQ